MTQPIRSDALPPIADADAPAPPTPAAAAAEPPAVEAPAAEPPAVEPPAVEPSAVEPSDPPPAVAPERTRFADPVASAPVATPAEVVEQPHAEPAPDAVGTAAEVATPAEAVEQPQVVVEPVEGHVDTDVVAVPAVRGQGLVAVLAGLVVILALLAGFLGWKVYDTAGSGPVEASRRAALDAARSSARIVFSYDYRHLANDFKVGRALTTGKFQAEYDQTTSKLVTDVAPRYKAVVIADVSDASVVRATESQVVALVFVNQQSSSSLMTTPKVTQSRLEMTMVRKNGHWLVAEIKAL
jgi:Mce-associated membrane protein